jgi:hypothetical protein
VSARDRGSDSQIRVTLLLADSAEAVNGKLYVLGGGWNLGGPAGQPIAMAVAIIISVPWHETNQRHSFRAVLLTEDGQPVPNPEGQPIEVTGGFDVGRPAGIKPGSSFNAPLAIRLNPALAAGGYRWEVSIDGTLMAAESFTIMDRPVGPSPAA